jgi:hypothetical protein
LQIVNGVVHVYIIKQLTNIDIFGGLDSCMPEHFKSKCQWKCNEVVKIRSTKPQPIGLDSNGSQERIHVLPHIAKNGQKHNTLKPSKSTSMQLN